MLTKIKAKILGQNPLLKPCVEQEKLFAPNMFDSILENVGKYFDKSRSQQPFYILIHIV